MPTIEGRCSLGVEPGPPLSYLPQPGACQAVSTAPGPPGTAVALWGKRVDKVKVNSGELADWDIDARRDSPRNTLAMPEKIQGGVRTRW